MLPEDALRPLKKPINTIPKKMKTINTLLIIGVAILATEFAHAAVYIGANGGDWNVAGNWSPSGVPDAVRADIQGSLTVDVNNTVTQQPTGILVGFTTPGTLIVNSTGSLTSNGSVVVGRTGTSGISTIAVNGGSLTMSGSSALTVGQTTGTGIFDLNGGAVSVGSGGINLGQSNTGGYGTGTLNITGSGGNLASAGTFQINQKGSILWDFNNGAALSLISLTSTAVLSRSAGSVGALAVDFANFSGVSGNYTITLFSVANGSAAGSALINDFTALNLGGKVKDVLFSSTYTVNGAPMALKVNFEAVPEPATLGLIGIAGLFILVRRRIFK